MPREQLTLEQFQTKEATNLQKRKEKAAELIDRLQKRQDHKTDPREIERLGRLLTLHSNHYAELETLDSTTIAMERFNRQQKLKPIGKIQPLR